MISGRKIFQLKKLSKIRITGKTLSYSQDKNSYSFIHSISYVKIIGEKTVCLYMKNKSHI